MAESFTSVWIPSNPILGIIKPKDIFDYTIQVQTQIEDIELFKETLPIGTTFEETESIETLPDGKEYTITRIICSIPSNPIRVIMLEKTRLNDSPFTEQHYVYYEIEVTQVNYRATVETTKSYKAHIKGYYNNPFDETLEYVNKSGEVVTLNTDETSDVWTKLNVQDVDEMTAFIPDPVRRKVFNFSAVGIDLEGETVSEKTYQIIVSDQDWTPGRIALLDVLERTKKS